MEIVVPPTTTVYTWEVLQSIGLVIGVHPTGRQSPLHTLRAPWFTKTPHGSVLHVVAILMLYEHCAAAVQDGADIQQPATAFVTENVSDVTQVPEIRVLALLVRAHAHGSLPVHDWAAARGVLLPRSESPVAMRDTIATRVEKGITNLGECRRSERVRLLKRCPHSGFYGCDVLAECKCEHIQFGVVAGTNCCHSGPANLT